MRRGDKSLRWKTPTPADRRVFPPEAVFEAGLRHHHIANTAYPGDVGTSDYLTERVVKGTPYLGLGLGAQSLSHHTLSYNLGAAAKALKPYVRAVETERLPIQDIYHLPLDVVMAKMIAVPFCFGEIHRKRFSDKFGVWLEDHFPREVDFVLQRGLMAHASPYLRLTPLGAEHFNGVVALFYAGAVKEYMIHLEGPGGSEAKAVQIPTAITAAQEKERCEQ
jgi:oxygen-independent coproporphyrinogen-3 oxidase